MWADNYWIFSDDKEKLTCMINDIIEELLDLDLEPKPESLWWMSTYKEEDKSTLKMGYAVRPGVGSSGRFRRTGKGVQVTEKTPRNGMGCWWQDGYTSIERRACL